MGYPGVIMDMIGFFSYNMNYMVMAYGNTIAFFVLYLYYNKNLI